LRDAGAGAVFVLLAGATADPAGALDDAIAYDRNRSLGHDHVAALRRRKPAQCWHVGTLRHFAAGAAAGGGFSVSLSNDGNTAIVGNASGAVVYARSTDGTWSQDATLAGTGAPAVRSAPFEGPAGFSVSLSADGDTAIVGTSVFTRSEVGWTHQELPAGTGAVGDAAQGFSVALPADGYTAIVGGPGDNNDTGAAWVYSELVFPGTPGKPNCRGQRTSGLSQTHDGLVAASVALGFASVRDLQNAIAGYCAG
jgi:hypothetical protein